MAVIGVLVELVLLEVLAALALLKVLVPRTAAVAQWWIVATELWWRTTRGSAETGLWLGTIWSWQSGSSLIAGGNTAVVMPLVLCTAG